MLPEDQDRKPTLGFEVLQAVSPNEIIVWANFDITLKEFEAIQPTLGWIKNQPRETDPDKGEIARSPGASKDGEFIEVEFFGHKWRHIATVIEKNIILDEQGLLNGNRVAKFHELTFNAGRTLKILVSPEGKRYVRVTRDLNRTSDEPSIPDGWQHLDEVIPEELTIQLPNPILNIRADNEDSYQGPIP
jgi:hypothetical protein